MQLQGFAGEEECVNADTAGENHQRKTNHHRQGKTCGKEGSHEHHMIQRYIILSQHTKSKQLRNEADVKVLKDISLHAISTEGHHTKDSDLHGGGRVSGQT